MTRLDVARLLEVAVPLWRTAALVNESGYLYPVEYLARMDVLDVEIEEDDE